MSVTHTPSPGPTTDADPFQALRDRLQGSLLTADHAAYEQARRTISLRSDRRPAAIVQAVCADDVASAVRFAREHGLLLAVRSGGHSLALHSVVDDALVIDLSLMKR